MPTPENPEAKQPIQPFVPVHPGERTELYSHRELQALADTDPRNELDELSEPLRFKKGVDVPGTSAEAGCWPDGMGNLLLTFLAGAAVGGVLVALTTPKSGDELRGDLRNLARRARWKAEDLAEEADEAWDDLNERIALAGADR